MAKTMKRIHSIKIKKEVDEMPSAIVKWLEGAGVTGDFSVEAPDILLYDANKRPIG